MSSKMNLVDKNLVDTYSDDINFYALTARQAVILLGQTEYIGWQTRWTNLDGTEDLIQIRDDINWRLMTPMTTDDICNCVEQGILRVFARAINGDADNVMGSATINPDGSVTYGGGGDGTGGNTSATILRDNMGQAQYIEQRLEEYLADWNTLYGLYGGTLTANQVADSDLYKALAVLYDIAPAAISGEENFTTSVFVDYADLQVNSMVGVFTSLNEIDRVIFCKGTAPSVISEFVFDDGEDEPLLRSQMLSLITPNQFAQWRSENTQISDDYLNTACYTLPDQNWTISGADIGNGSYNQPPTGITTLGNRIYALIFDGLITDANGKTWDGLYTNDNGSLSYEPLTLKQGFGSTYTPSPVPAYNPNGYPDGVIYNVGAWNEIRVVGLNLTQPCTGAVNFIFRDFGSL